MDTISFNKNEFTNVANSCANFCRDLKISSENVEKQVTLVTENWQGQQYENAKLDINTIRNNMASIISNAETISKILNEVSQGFSDLKYKG